jgi:hypothetical protein
LSRLAKRRPKTRSGATEILVFIKSRMTNIKDMLAELLYISNTQPMRSERICTALVLLRDDLRDMTESGAPASDAPQTTAERSVLTHGTVQDIRAWVELTRRYGKLTRFELIALADEFQKMDKSVPRITRNDKRHTVALVQWMEKNWNRIEPCLPSVCFLDEEYNLVQGATVDE